MAQILLCPHDRQGCGRYRLGLPAAALQQQESDLEIYLSEGLPVRLDLATGRAVGLADGFGGWDVIVVQRPMSDWQVECLRECRKLGIRTIVEVDDDFEALHHLAPAFFTTHPRQNASWNRKWLRVACQEADLVTVTTPALAKRYAPHGRVVVIPNYFPESWLTVDVEREGNVVGWTGTVGTHQGDLTMTRGGVAQALRETDAHFRVIGRHELVKRDLSLDEEPECVYWQQWQKYPLVVATLDVGIAPLTDTAFNHSKSWLKPLEYAALGVPCVMSPNPSYLDLQQRHGIGIIAESRSRDWRRAIKSLLLDENYRREVGAEARFAASELTIEKNAYRFAEAWTAVRDSPRAKSLAKR